MNLFVRHTQTIPALLLVLLLSGCTKTSIDEVPSYINIAGSKLIVTDIQGSGSQKISDAWVYADNDLVGAFELPKKFPVLKSGTTQLLIFAGIKLNGFNETRSPYPFYEKISIPVNLEREKITDLGLLTFSYVAGTKFAWKEDFEQANLSIDTTARSEVNLVRTQLAELATVFPGEGNKYTAKVLIPNDSVVFECATHDSFILPTDGSSVFLEMNYKSNNEFTVGLLVNGSVSSQRSILVINPSSSWNKIYINLTPTLSSITSATSFRVFLTAKKNTKDANGEIYFDNMKLLHF